MKDRILELEKSFFKIQYIQDLEWLDQHIHDHFTECGKSGMIYHKKDTVEALFSCTEDRKIEIYNFECQFLNENSYLVHYLTKSKEDLIYRTSIWVMEENLKLLFHQATKLNQHVILNRA